MIGNFEENSSFQMRETLKTKKCLFLNDSFKAFENSLKHITNTVIINENVTQSSSSAESKSSEKQNQVYKDHQDDEWLSYFMFGKIKEKLQSEIFECLQCYSKVSFMKFSIIKNINLFN